MAGLCLILPGTVVLTAGMCGELASEKFEVLVGKPKTFGRGAALVIHAYGLFMVVPVAASVVVMSFLPPGWFSLLLPILTLAATAVFLPFGLGNSYISRRVRAEHSQAIQQRDAWVVQVALSPRVRSGLSGLFEDADDWGILTLTDSALCFEGDSIRMRMPYDQIARAESCNIGLRGLYLYGPGIVVTPRHPGDPSVLIAERSSRLLLDSHAIMRRITGMLDEKLRCEFRKAASLVR